MCGLQRFKQHLVHVAVLGGDTTILALLLESGDLPVDSPAVARYGPHHGYTPLALAVSRNDVHMMEILLVHGAYVTLGHRWRPLAVAVVHSPIDAVHILLEHGADTEIPGGCHGNLPLVYAIRCSEENTEIFRLLLEHGAQPDALNGIRKSVLYVAASSSNLEVTAVLIASGADVNARDAMGRVVIHGAVDDAVVRVLIAEGTDVDAADGEGNTALRRAALSSDMRTLTTLLAHGASALIQDEHGLTLLCYAARYGKGEAVSAHLVAKGVREDFVGPSGLLQCFRRSRDPGPRSGCRRNTREDERCERRPSEPGPRVPQSVAHSRVRVQVDDREASWPDKLVS